MLRHRQPCNLAISGGRCIIRLLIQLSPRVGLAERSRWKIQQSAQKLIGRTICPDFHKIYSDWKSRIRDPAESGIGTISDRRFAAKMARMQPDQEFLEFVIKGLVDNPDAVQTDRKVDEMGVLITLKVDPADMGKVIGRNGQTAKAIRSLLRVVGIKNNARVNLKIEEPEGGRGPRVSREDREGGRSRDVDEVVDDLRL